MEEVRLHANGLGFRCAALPGPGVWGDQDPALGRTAAELTADFVAADYRLAVLEGAGHWLQFERPSELSRLLIDWIRSHAEPPQVEDLESRRG
jgi:pimeloyl-ACP methyl ester carboxylesterase